MSEGERIGRVRLTLFSVAEAQRTALEIKSELQALVATQRELDRIRSRIGVLELAVAGASPENPDARELRTLSTRRETLTARLHHGVQSIHRRGCLVKDLEKGLIDFYALNGDQLIFLCWQLGEPEVRHWHTLDGGFAARRPIPKSESGELPEGSEPDDHGEQG